jgi:tetratricopeptide (TPR) repeat protein
MAENFNPQLFLGREKELRFLKKILKFEGKIRFLTIKDRERSGKSTILQMVQHYCRDLRIPVSLISLDQLSNISSLSLLDMIYEILSKQNVEFKGFKESRNLIKLDNESSFLAYINHSQAVHGSITIGNTFFQNIEKVNVMGVHVEHAEHVTSSFEHRPLSEGQKESIVSQCVQEFYRDLLSYTSLNKAVLIFDDYDGADDNLINWVKDELLNKLILSDPANLLVVFAGTNTPNIKEVFSYNPEYHQEQIHHLEPLSKWEEKDVRRLFSDHQIPYTEENFQLLLKMAQNGFPIGLITEAGVELRNREAIVEQNHFLIQVNQLITSQASPDDFARTFWLRNYETQLQQNPTTAEMMLAVAIPAYFDLEIIAVLRGEVFSEIDNQILLQILSEFSFVIERTDGKSYTYHKSIQKIVQEEFRNQEQREVFEKYRLRLINYYEMQFQKNWEENKYTNAVSNLSNLIELTPDKIELYLIRGLLHINLGDYQQTVNDLSKTIKYWSNEPTTYFLRAQAYYELKNYSDALTDINFANQLSEKKNWKYLVFSARIKAKLDKLDEALSDINLVIFGLTEPNAYYYYLRCKFNIEKGDFSNALQDITRSIAIDGANTIFYNAKAYILHKQGQQEAALESLNRAIELDPKDVQNYLLKRRIYRDKGNNEAAWMANTGAINCNPDNGYLYFLRARISFSLNHKVETENDLKKSLELNFQDSGVFELYAKIYYQTGNLNEALDAINRAIDITPKNIHYHKLRRRVNRDLNKTDDALTDSNNLINLQPHVGEWYFERARVYESLGDYSKAIRDLDKALELHVEDSVFIYFHKALIYKELKSYELALENINQVIDQKANHEDALYLRGEIYYAKKSFDKALADFKQVSLSLPDIKVYLYMRRIYRDNGDNQSALEVTNQAIKLDANNRELYLARARIYQDLGNNELAQADFEKAKTISR